jgi:hypothetical protein
MKLYVQKQQQQELCILSRTRDCHCAGRADVQRLPAVAKIAAKLHVIMSHPMMLFDQVCVLLALLV